MRTTPAGQITTMDGNNYSVHTRVQVKNGSGTFKDLSSLSGYNWIDEVEWDEDIDQPVAQVRVRLWREVGALSLAPLDTASTLNRLDDGLTYSPLLNLTREIKVEVATLAANATPAAGDWVHVFHGYIDAIDWPKTESHVEVVARDLGGKLADTFIETERTYGSTAGIAMETVIQSILTDNSTGVTLYTPTSPGFVITTYVQQKESVLDAARTLAQMIGWDVRYKWDSGTSTFRFTLYEPNRTKTLTDKTFNPNFYIDVQQLSIDVAGIRNVVKCIYTDTDTGARSSQSASNAASITKYGRRYMEIEEPDESPIDTSTEASALVADAVLDLCEPKATMEIETLFWWPVEMGDLYRFASNGIHFDSAQDIAVVSYRHALSMDSHRTFIKVRGQPCGAYVGWLEREKRNAGEPQTKEPPVFQPRATLSSDQSTADIAGVVSSKSGEECTLYIRDDESTSAPLTWRLVTSSVDSTPLWVGSGSDITAISWFHDGSNFAQKLNDIALTRDQVERVFFQTEGKTTGIRSDWKPFTIDLQGSPWLESVTLVWDDVALDRLLATTRGGARANSIMVEFTDDSSFATIDSTSYATLGDGASLQSAYTPSASLRDQMWFVRVTPYNGPISGGVPTGLAGKAQVASVYVTGNVSKKIRISAGAMSPAVDTTTHQHGNGEVGPRTWSTATPYTFQAEVVLPANGSVTITGLRLRGYKQDSADTCSASLLRLDDIGGSAIVGTCALGAVTGYNTTSTTSVSETTSGRSYKITWLAEMGGLVGASKFVYFEIDYTMPDYQAAV